MKKFLSNIFALWAIIVVAIIIVNAFGCKTSEIIKEVTVIKIKDSTAIHVDTTWVTYHNPADSLRLTGQLSAFMDSLGQCKVKNSSGVVETGKIKIKYIIRNDSIFIECNTAPYDIKIASLNTTIEHFKEYYESYTKDTLAVKHKKWLSFWYSWMCLGVILVFVMQLLLRIFKLKVAIIGVPPFIIILPKFPK